MKNHQTEHSDILDHFFPNPAETSKKILYPFLRLKNTIDLTSLYEQDLVPPSPEEATATKNATLKILT